MATWYINRPLFIDTRMSVPIWHSYAGLGDEEIVRLADYDPLTSGVIHRIDRSEVESTREVDGRREMETGKLYLLRVMNERVLRKTLISEKRLEDGKTIGFERHGPYKIEGEFVDGQFSGEITVRMGSVNPGFERVVASGRVEKGEFKIEFNDDRVIHRLTYFATRPSEQMRIYWEMTRVSTTLTSLTLGCRQHQLMYRGQVTVELVSFPYSPTAMLMKSGRGSFKFQRHRDVSDFEYRGEWLYSDRVYFDGDGQVMNNKGQLLVSGHFSRGALTEGDLFDTVTDSTSSLFGQLFGRYYGSYSAHGLKDGYETDELMRVVERRIVVTEKPVAIDRYRWDEKSGEYRYSRIHNFAVWSEETKPVSTDCTTKLNACDLRHHRFEAGKITEILKCP